MNEARTFLKILAGAAAVIPAGLALFLLAVDPYDRGHGIFPVRGTLENGPRTADASRGRDPSFNAAVIGNSHAQILAPDGLNAAAPGLAFVQLTVPGTGPREHFAMLGWFARSHGAGARAVVLGVDQNYCAVDTAMPLQHPFPFWLYDAGPLTYAANLFRARALRSAARRLILIAGRKPAVRPDGFWDYAGDYTRNDAWQKTAAAMRTPGYWNSSGQFPVAGLLAEKLRALPSATRVILLVPPIFAAGLPAAGSADAAGERACVTALERVALGRPGTRAIDMRQDNEATRAPLNFSDMTHYARPLAQIAEGRIGAALRGME